MSTRAAAAPALEGGADPVVAMLDEYGVKARQRLREYLRDRGSGHLAYLYDLLRDYPSRGGRSLRPTLCMAAARAFGGSLEDALNSAVALEILHNAFLIHDDVEDLSEQRRGRPTMHALHGVPMAVNAGDAMTVLSLRPLLDNRRTLGTHAALRIMEEAESMGREAVEGQALELGWRRDNAVDLDEADYLRMVLKKTCSYTTIFPLRVGAIIAGRDGPALAQLSRFGFFLGAAFQIQDDLLNLIGDPKQYGKEIAGDIWEGKRTLMLIHLLSQAGPQDRAWLQRLMGLPRDRIGAVDVERVLELMERHGSIEYGRAFAHACAGAALHEFSVVFADVPPSRDRDFIERLCTWVLGRA